MEEKWDWIKGMEGKYEVSTFGRIKSHCYGKTPKIMRTCGRKDGYVQVQLRVGGEKTNLLVHRLVASVFVCGFDEEKTVNHIDGNKANNSPENLEWITQSENVLHAYRTKLKPTIKGSRHGRSKLDESKVLEIRRRAKDGTIGSLAGMAREYEVGPTTIKKVIDGISWVHV